jgi:tetratricopeptide (TPR) repeat protein
VPVPIFDHSVNHMARTVWSTNKDYQAFGICFAERDYEGAERHLRIVLSQAISARDNVEKVAFLILTIGKIKYRAGQPRSAARYFSQADRASQKAALIRLLIGEFYLECTENSAVAVKWLKKAMDSGQTSGGRFNKRWSARAEALLVSAVNKKPKPGSQ